MHDDRWSKVGHRSSNTRLQLQQRRIRPPEADLIRRVAEANSGRNVGGTPHDVVLLDDHAMTIEVLDDERDELAREPIGVAGETVAAQAGDSEDLQRRP